MIAKRTVVFITIYPLSEDYGIKYGFRYWISKGYNVKVINVFQFLYSSSVIDLIPHYLDDTTVFGVKQIAVVDEYELRNELKNIKGWKISVLIASYNHKIISLLKCYRINYMVLNHLVMPLGGQSLKNRIKKRVGLIFSPKELAKKVMAKIENLQLWWVKYHYPPLYLTSIYDVVAINNTSVITVNSFDYDRVISNKLEGIPNFIPDTEYLVLLASHPWPVHDIHLLDIKTKVTKEEYSIIINRFIKLVEENMSIKIVIAAYPKATDDENIYQGREFIKNNTEQLVKYSKGVIGHHTGAFNFAVLHNKPSCVISIKSLKDDDNFYLLNKAYAREMCVPINYIDTEEDCIMVIRNGIFRNNNCYDKFKSKYLIAARNSNKRIWHVVAEQFEKDINEDIENGVIY